MIVSFEVQVRSTNPIIIITRPAARADVKRKGSSPDAPSQLRDQGVMEPSAALPLVVSPESAPDSSQTVEYSSLLQHEEIGDAAQAASSMPQGLPAEETLSDPAALLWFVMMVALGIVGWVFLHKMIW